MTHAMLVVAYECTRFHLCAIPNLKLFDTYCVLITGNVLIDALVLNAFRETNARLFPSGDRVTRCIILTRLLFVTQYGRTNICVATCRKLCRKTKKVSALHVPLNNMIISTIYRRN